MNLNSEKVLIIGMSRTGIALARFSDARRWETLVMDDADSRPQLPGYLDGKCRWVDPSVDRDVFDRLTLVLPSPGVPATHPVLLKARNEGVRILSEPELAFRFCTGRVIAITGTNGKTTTTSLAAHMLAGAGLRVRATGNIGTPFIGEMLEKSQQDWYVLEMSSFQLEHIEEFSPAVAIVTNVTADHEDRHTPQEYFDLKTRIFRRMGSDGLVVVNGADERLVEAARKVKCRVVAFDRQGDASVPYRVEKDRYYFRRGDGKDMAFPVSGTRLAGRHNQENVLAVLPLIELLDLPVDKCLRALGNFPGVEHRLELFLEREGVRFYNDSKATNPDSAVVALESFDRGVVLFAGGYEKGSDFKKYAEAARGRVIATYLFGRCADRIEEAFKEAGVESTVEHCIDLKQAVSKAKKHLETGNVFLLAPACASWDQFENYEQRGRLFKQYCGNLASEKWGAVVRDDIGGLSND